MKKALGIAVVMLVAMGLGAFAATSVIDNVGVSYSAGGNVALLGLVDKDGVSLSLNGGSYQASVAGERATLQGGSSSVEATGGWLHYTLRGNSSQKITVAKSTSGSDNTGYNDATLGVKINTISTGTYSSTASTVATAYATSYVSITGTAASLITGISGSDTWTGTSTAQGAQLKYQLIGDPGVTNVKVVYTLVGE